MPSRLHHLGSAFWLTVLVGCSGYRPAHFATRPVVTVILDDHPIETPAADFLPELEYLSDTYLLRPAITALSVTRPSRAVDVNAYDEVPASSWFLPFSPSKTAARYETEGAPWPPYTFLPEQPATGGDGVVVIDARGKRYDFVTDPPRLPNTVTAAKAIGGRLLRALGYRTAEDWIIDLRANDLLTAASSTDSPEEATIRGLLEGAPPLRRDGTYRVCATRWPGGLDLGPTAAFGTRGDDPNDQIPHEDRRSLRALGVVSAWLDWHRIGPYDTRDLYFGRPDRGFVLHYLVGYHDALGVEHLPRPPSHPTPAGPVRGDILENLVTLGLKSRPASSAKTGRDLTAMPTDVMPGRFEPPYEPVLRMSAEDGYFIAKRIARLPNHVLDWAIDAGRLPAKIARSLRQTLEARRRQVVAQAFRQLTPLEPMHLHLGRAQLELRDEALFHEYASVTETVYEVQTLTGDGDWLLPSQRLRAVGTRLAIPLLDVFLESPDYFVLSVHVVRRGRRAPRAFEAHLAAADEGYRLVGIVH